MTYNSATGFSLYNTALPEMSESNNRLACRNRYYRCRNPYRPHSTGLDSCTVPAVPSGLGICFLAKPILLFIFPNRIRECAVSEQSLAFLGIAVIFLALSFPIFSCLQATGRADIPVKLMLAGVAVKLAGNLVLITIPEINVAGAAISTLLCYFIIFVLSLVFIIVKV